MVSAMYGPFTTDVPGSNIDGIGPSRERRRRIAIGLAGADVELPGRARGSAGISPSLVYSISPGIAGFSRVPMRGPSHSAAPLMGGLAI